MITLSLQEKISLAVFGALVLGVLGAEVFLWIRFAVGRRRRVSPRRALSSPPAVVVHLLAGLGIVCVLYGYFVEPYWVEVNVIPLRTPQLKNTSFRIVQISDLHVDTIPRNEDRMLRLIGDLAPDIIVATGDFLNEEAAAPRLKETLGRLEAPLGRFAVAGNFEKLHWPGMDLLAGTGFRLLEKQTVTVTKDGESLGLHGLGFFRSDRAGQTIEPLPADRFDVLLYHTPDLAEDLEGLGVDLYLCGHTHGGQIAMPFYGALITFSKHGKKYESGLYRIGDMTLYVNRGLGLEPRPAPQMRFCARPEIAVFDIGPQK
jgi:hypothetical protein